MTMPATATPSISTGIGPGKNPIPQISFSTSSIKMSLSKFSQEKEDVKNVSQNWPELIQMDVQTLQTGIVVLDLKYEEQEETPGVFLNPELEASYNKAREDSMAGRVHRFANLVEAINWLKE